MNDDDEVYEATAYTVFRVDCGGCGAVIELDDADPTGEVVECDCGAKTKVVGAP
jgi:hypothetical protein